MGYVDNELMNRWKWKGTALQRHWPLRLVDREGFAALIEAVRSSAGAQLTVTLNGIVADAGTIDEVTAKMPRRVVDVSLYGDRGAVNLSSKHAGATQVYQNHDSSIGLAGIVSALENHGRPLSLWSRLFWWLPLVREQPVASTRRRDEVDDRAENRRNATISALLGVVGGIIGGVATIYAASRWGATP